MQEVLEFLKENRIFFLATTEDDQPRVRPFGFVMEYDGKLCFCTNNKKDVYKQMIQNPKIEISACSNDGKWLRVNGSAVFISEAAAKEKALEEAPGLKNMYSVNDGIFEIFTLENASAVLCSFTGDRKILTV